MRLFILECNDQSYRLDDTGFLIDQVEWNEELAVALASMMEAEPLSAVQLDVLRFLRECFLRHKVFPIINSLCRIDPQPDNCANEPFIEPKKAWKMCGLTQEDGVRCLEQCGKNSPTEPAAAGGPST